MRSAYITLTAIICSLHVLAQSEFTTYKNGLIYSETTMGKLGHIVDSLNLKYKNCDLNKTFYSKSQTIGQIVSLDSVNIPEAKKDMDNNLSFEAFVDKYPKAIIRKDILVVKYKYKNYENKELVNFAEVSPDGDYDFEIDKENTGDLYHKPVKNTWVYEYHEKTQYSNESIRAFYFPDEFNSMKIADKYARQIGYSDCLIDTVSAKLKDNLKDGWVELPKNWQSLSLKKKQKLLDDMRSIEVIGGCSMDSRPREHAINIALLSAETTNWEVFLKAHLDIMNDRFDRMSDGSYAWAQRKTYIKELEDLDINVTDLLMGISFRMENPASNHYYGSIGRLGRAITESKNRSDFESSILSMIEDKELDDYNRLLAYFLFLSYNNNLKGKPDQDKNLARLKLSVARLPSYLSEKIDLEEK